MTTTIVENKKYTYEDYVNIHDDKRYELLEGELLMTPSPVPKHQRIIRKLGFILDNFVSANNIGEIFLAPCDVYLDDENVVQPDIMFISKERLHIIGKKNIQEAPCLAIEIISASSAYRDTVQKKELYARFGVKEYWLVMPEEELIEIYQLKDNTYQLYKTYRKNDTMDSPILKGIEIELKEIF